MPDMIALLTEAIEHIRDLERQLAEKRADTPPPLPPQWRHESSPPRKRVIHPGEWCYSAGWTQGDSEYPICQWVHEDQSTAPYEHWPVVPAQPRPADCTDADGVTWTAGKYASPDECVRVGTWFCRGQLDTTRIGGTPYRGEHNGWRWTAVPVKKQPEVRRVVDSVYDRTGAHVEQVPLYETAPHSRRFRLDREAIAREEVIRELERLAREVRPCCDDRISGYVYGRIYELRGER